MAKTPNSLTNLKLNKIERILFNCLDNLVVFLNKDLDIIYLNDYSKSILGYKNEKILGDSFLSLIDTEDQSEIKEFIQNLFTDNEFEIDLKLIPRRGKPSWYELKGIKIEENGITNLVIILGQELKKKKYELLKEKEENLQEFYDSLTEIRFWKLFQNKEFSNALERSQEMLNIVINNIPQYIAWKDRNLIYLGCNENYASLCGLKAPKEIIGKTDIELKWNDEFAINLMQKHNDILNSEHSEYHRLESWTLDGEKKWFEMNEIILHDEKENVVGILTAFEDKTDQIKANRKIKESEQKFRDLTELLPDIIYEADLDLNITYLNKAGFQISGYSPEDLDKGLNIQEIILEDDQDQLLNHIQYLLEGKETSPNYYRIKKKEGGTFYGLTHSRPIFKNGKIVGLRGVVHDLTERKMAEEKYMHLFESAPYGIWLVNSKGKIIDCNKTMEEIFLTQYKSEDLIGKNFVEILKWFENPKYFIPLFKKRFNQMKQGKKLEPIEFLMKRGDGKKLWITLQTTTFELGGESFYQVIIQDITYKKKAEQKIRESEEKLKKLNKELENKVLERTKELRESERKLKEQNIQLRQLDNIKNEFITNAAHELKTPLISISGYTDYILLKYRKSLSPEIKKDLRVVKRNVSRLENLMNQLLEVMKIDENKLKLNKEKIKIAQLVRECIQELSYHILEKNHNLVVNIEEDLTINGDIERIFQLFTNLLSNAIKFTQPNGKIEVNVESQDDDFYLFSVKDNGLGLSDEEIGKLFKKFEMIKNPQIELQNKMTGTGLGLYITKGIIEAHGGKIWAESEGPNKGTTFYFTLPK